ncbi:c-type cytochrome [Sulfurovum mangrovi]|uniref:c-type cytochrome n=1 Tax=Sulfurovum mangrovi TaxID=2893889 RepID=UPI001E29D8E7|nr:cytochrome c [Sulfurovum mangrovi]UFH58175.1 cytochrome c [Sulfurovum mangrovi]
MKIIQLGFMICSTSLLLMAGGQELYNIKCKSCHGIDGSTKALGQSQIIKDMSTQDIVDAMNSYASGDKQGAQPFVKAIKKDFVTKHTQEELKAVAEYISKP